MPTQSIFDQLLVLVNLYQDAKNQPISLICSGDMVDKKILQSDWLRTFTPYLRNKNFSKYEICAGIQPIIQISIKDQIQ